MYGQNITNHFIASRKGDPFIKRLVSNPNFQHSRFGFDHSLTGSSRHDLFLHVWKGRTNYSGLIEHPLLQWATTVSLDENKDANFN
jgi:hypothetical protein